MKTKPKHTTRTRTESEKWTSPEGFQWGGEGRNRGKRYREEAAELVA